MKEFKHLVRDIMPCWYELGWDGNPKQPAINISVHKDFIRQTKEIPADAPIIVDLKKQLGLGDFCRDMNQGFGFEGAFKKISETDEFIIWSGKLPKIRKDEKQKCNYCKGTGEGLFEGDKCLSCEGSGFEHKIDWHDAHAFSASFTVFSMLTEFTEITTSSLKPQLLTVTTSIQEGMGGASINGIFGIDLVRWLSSMVNYKIEEMIKAMMVAYNFMWKLKPFGSHDFNARVDFEGGNLNVQCPGDACGLNPSHSSGPRPERGYELSDHNVDSPLQQLTLLAGLAALHDLARKEIG